MSNPIAEALMYENRNFAGYPEMCTECPGRPACEAPDSPSHDEKGADALEDPGPDVDCAVKYFHTALSSSLNSGDGR